ncbi:MAG TPA: phospholipase D-like domain-containing protein [Oscillospiraceae bacterium]|nr:phospholipase D-like domain-containing protein [Oscillospiraceae bacterium]
MSTPYLVLDNEMITALILAQESGVDVRIITPYIPDKWYVHTVTHSNYPVLVQAGVRIYEFEPGFIHSKTIIADDEIGIVGTTNFDFRSFYLHFENGIYMYKSKAVMQVKNDYDQMMNQCIEITPEKCKTTLLKKFILSVMKLFSPFL